MEPLNFQSPIRMHPPFTPKINSKANNAGRRRMKATSNKENISDPSFSNSRGGRVGEKIFPAGPNYRLSCAKDTKKSGGRFRALYFENKRN